MRLLTLQRFPGTLTLTLLLGVVTFFLYASTLSFGFISIDDSVLVLQNPLIQRLDSTTLKRIFTSYDPELYVPVTMLSYHIDYLIGGLTPKSYHAQNLLLHILTTLLVFRLFLSLRLEKYFAFFGALLFAIHPINTEAVAWVAARKDLLSTFFGLLSLNAFVEFLHSRDRRWFFLVAATFTLGLLSKVTILLLPGVFYLLFPKEELLVRKLRTLAPLLTLSVVLAVVAVLGKMKTFGAAISLFSYPLLAAKALTLTLFHFFVPLSLSPMYPQLTPVTFARAEFLVPILVTISLGVIAYFFSRRNFELKIGVALFLAGFLPSFLTFTKNGEVYITSDRYVYLASIGLFFLFACALRFLWTWLQRQQKNFHFVVPTLAVLIITTLSLFTLRQVHFWESNEKLMRHIITLAPAHAIAYNNLGADLRDQGKDDEAEEQYRQAVAVNPHFVLPHINLATLHRAQGKVTEAEAEYRNAIAAIDRSKSIRSDDLLGYYLLASLVTERGDDAEALALFSEAALLGKDNAEAQYNLAVTLHRLGKIPEAVIAYEKATILDPSLIAAHYALAELYAGSGRLQEALEELDTVLALDAMYPGAELHRERIREILGE